MGYDIHVTRAAQWSENRGEEISASEWHALIEEDEELVPDRGLGDHAVRWLSSESPPDAWFDWYAGNVFTTNPGPAVLNKALSIAVRFDAHVEGDDGRIYCGAADSEKLPV